MMRKVTCVAIKKNEPNSTYYTKFRDKFNSSGQFDRKRFKRKWTSDLRAHIIEFAHVWIEPYYLENLTQHIPKISRTTDGNAGFSDILINLRAITFSFS